MKKISTFILITEGILSNASLTLSDLNHEYVSFKFSLVNLKNLQVSTKEAHGSAKKSLPKLLGKYTHDATVDGSHPTDLGFMMITENLEKVIKKYIEIK